MREHSVPIALSLVDQARLVTAASEVVHNGIRYAAGGEVCLNMLDGTREGVLMSGQLSGFIHCQGSARR